MIMPRFLPAFMSYLALGKIFLVAIFLNMALLPAESGGDLGVKFSIIIRLFAWLVLIGVAVFHSRSTMTLPVRSVAIVAIYLFMFIVANYDYDNLSINWIFCVFFIITGALIIQVTMQQSLSYRKTFLKALEIIIIFWISTYLFQLIIYLSTDNVLDIHKMFAPYSEQRSELVTGELVRLGGVHIEPGTYSNWLYGLLLIRSLYSGKIFDRVTFFSLVTIPLTLSFWGVISTLFFIGSYVVSKKLLNFKKIFFIFFIVIIALGLSIQLNVYDKFVSYIEARSTINRTDKLDSTNIKIFALESFAKNIDEYIIFGKNYDYYYYGRFYSEQDTGIFLNTIVKVGGVWTVIMFSLIFQGVYRILGISGVLFAIPLIIAKWFYWDHIFWLVLLASTSKFELSQYSQTAVSELKIAPRKIMAKTDILNLQNK